MPTASCSWDQIADRAFLQIMRNFERTPAFEHGLMAALKERKFSAQIIWGKDDRTLENEKNYAPHLLKALDLEGYEGGLRKTFFCRKDSIPRAIASFIARLISASGKCCGIAVKSFLASFYSALRDDRGSRDGASRRPLMCESGTLAKAAMSEKCTNSEMWLFGGSGLQATSKGRKADK